MNKSRETYPVAFITGGSRGIGAATVKRFASLGWSVAFTYVRSKMEAELLREEAQKLILQARGLEKPGQNTATDAPQEAQKAAPEDGQEKEQGTGTDYGENDGIQQGSYPDVLALQSDASNFEQTADAVRQARTYFGRPAFDAVICNAGVAHNSLITKMSDDAVHKMININLIGYINTAKAVLPGMVRNDAGTIVMVSSVWGGRRGASCESVYAATKAGIEGLVRSLAAEYGPSGIRINAVAPGVIATDMNMIYSESEMNALAERTPMGRTGKPEEVADLIAYLAGDAASFITGQIIGVDGGFGI